MTALLVFSIVLLASVLVSSRADRTVLSTAVLFLVAGFVCGSGVLGVINVSADDPAVSTLAEWALVAVLFTDGMKVGVRDLRNAWRLPGRALLFGLPLTMAVTALFAYFVAGFDVIESLLLGATLAPTDPVFAAAIVGHPGIPVRLRQLLNVESGLNDGLALPVVLILLATLTGSEVSVPVLVEEIAAGLGIGVVVALLAVRLERLEFLASTTAYQPLNALAVGLMVFSLAKLTGSNEFLAVFAAGVTIASTSETVRDSFERFGALLAEVLKLAALLLFGAVIAPSFLAQIPWSGYVFALLVLVLARPLAMGLALARSSLTRRGWIAASWFGPKGFASLVYGLLILNSGVEGSEKLFHLVALVVFASIILHSSTDVVMARWFTNGHDENSADSGEVAEDPALDEDAMLDQDGIPMEGPADP